MIMTPPFTVRRARAADIPLIVERWGELMRAHQALDATLYGLAPHGEATYRAFLRRHLDERGSVVLVANEGHAGYLTGGLGQRAPMFAVREVGMIFDLVVRPDLRRRGIGRGLVEAALAHFEALGLSHVQVDFDPNNPSATHFWGSMGFGTRLCEAYRAF